jgi:hypothetical protein
MADFYHIQTESCHTCENRKGDSDFTADGIRLEGSHASTESRTRKLKTFP